MFREFCLILQAVWGTLCMSNPIPILILVSWTRPPPPQHLALSAAEGAVWFARLSSFHHAKLTVKAGDGLQILLLYISFAVARDCASLGCSHNCTESEMGPICYCPAGYRLGPDEINCEGKQLLKLALQVMSIGSVTYSDTIWVKG